MSVQIKTNIGYTTAARLRDGGIFAWSNNSAGQIGNNTTGSSQATPTAVSIDAGISYFGIDGQTARGGSPLVSVATGANKFVRLGDATVNFANIATAGLTLPTGYTLLTNANGYDITASAQFTGTANGCVKAPFVIDSATFNRLYLLHDDDFDGTLDIGTGGGTPRNYQKRELCRLTASFSPFVIAQSSAPTASEVSVSGRALTFRTDAASKTSSFK